MHSMCIFNQCSRLMFSRTNLCLAAFYFCGKVNRHILWFLGTENPHATLTHDRDSLKTNVACAINNSSVFRPFFFVENLIMIFTYRVLLSEWLLAKLDEVIPDFILRKDDAPPIGIRTKYLNSNLLHSWNACVGSNDMQLLFWPHRSLDLMPSFIFSYGGTWRTKWSLPSSSRLK